MLCVEMTKNFARERKNMQPISKKQGTRFLFALTGAITVVVGLLTASVPARSETIDVSDDHGGSVVAYDRRWAALARRGVNVRVVGPCQSACTVLMRHIPRNRICVTPEASFGFHLARKAEATAILRSGYSADIRAWINRHGGLTDDFIWMSAPDTYRYFRKCR
jgi:hypothetical protein